MRSAVRVTVPASTANLGSGFDAFGMALALYDTVTVRLADTLTVEVTGEGAEEVPRDQRHLVVGALCAAAERIGLPLPGAHVSCVNVIPHARGLGSSAGAVVAGIAAAYGLAGRSLDRAALQLAGEFESHADNVAASLFGDLQLVWTEDGRYHSVGLATHDTLRPVVFVPEVRSSTHATRGLLPDTVPRADAVFAAGRSALAVHALTTDPALLLPATADRLHQRYRRPAFPASMDLVEALRAKGIPAAISGAGPSVLAFGPVPDDLGAGFTRRELAVDRAGVRVEVCAEPGE